MQFNKNQEIREKTRAYVTMNMYNPHLTIALINSWLSKQSMEIVMLLKFGENASLGKWCIKLRVSYKKIQNNQKPNIKLSDEEVQRLNDAGFKWSVRRFDKRFNALMALKQSMGILMLLKLVRMLLLGNGVLNREFRIRKSKTIRSQT
jgi:hypothetical protein